MGNQQVSNFKYDVLLDGIDINKIRHNKLHNVRDFILDIHKSYTYLRDRYGLSRDEAKRLKNKIYNQYEENIPNGYCSVKNHPGYIINISGEIRSKRKRNIIKPRPNVKGYLSLSLGSQTQRVHRCVAETFIPNPENKETVNHKNGNKLDNRVDNLEWATSEENRNHAVKNNLFKTVKNRLANTGSNNNMSKLNEDIVIEIRNCKRLTVSELSWYYDVSEQTIRDILGRRTWKHI